MFLNSRLTFIVIACFVSCCIDGLDLLRSYIHILLVVSTVFVLGYIKIKVWRKMEVVYLIFERMLVMCFSFLYTYPLYVFCYLGYKSGNIISNKR